MWGPWHSWAFDVGSKTANCIGSKWGLCGITCHPACFWLRHQVLGSKWKMLCELSCNICVRRKKNPKVAGRMLPWLVPGLLLCLPAIRGGKKDLPKRMVPISCCQMQPDVDWGRWCAFSPAVLRQWGIIYLCFHPILWKMGSLGCGVLSPRAQLIPMPCSLSPA